MVIALSGVKFGLKSYTWFQNQTSMQVNILNWCWWFNFRYTVRLSIEKNHLKKTHLKLINNGNCSEWSKIWAEIIRMISKSNEHAAKPQVLFHKYYFRPRLYDTRFNYHFITSILKSPKQDLVSSNILLMQY